MTVRTDSDNVEAELGDELPGDLVTEVNRIQSRIEDLQETVTEQSERIDRIETELEVLRELRIIEENLGADDDD